MFIVNLTYIKPLEEIEVHLETHRVFLDRQYAEGVFLASGPKNPRDGGIILVSGEVSRSELDKILSFDPFWLHQLARYEVTEFLPVKYASGLGGVL